MSITLKVTSDSDILSNYCLITDAEIKQSRIMSSRIYLLKVAFVFFCKDD